MTLVIRAYQSFIFQHAGFNFQFQNANADVLLNK